MDSNERKLSDFIDQLNADQKPNDDEHSTTSPELKELYGTVKLVRSLKEPTMPEDNFGHQLTHSLVDKISKRNPVKYKKWTWLSGVASIAAILIIMMNFVLPFGNTNIVHAMEAAFQGVKAYHGVLEIVETNQQGDSITQSKLEVWTNKEGNYYIKGLEGSNKNIITVNNGQKKWQIRPDKKQVHLLPTFPDSYRFVFEIGNEIKDVKNALSTKVVGEDKIAGRDATILEVKPQGGETYQIWIDKKTKLPLQKQFAMHNAIQYKITYTQIDFRDTIPEELTSYHIPHGYKEINTNPEQLVNDLNEVQEQVGFTPKLPESIPTGYSQDSIAVVPNQSLVKIYYNFPDKNHKVIVIQGKSGSKFKPSSSAILGKVDSSVVEIQSPVHDDFGVLGGGGQYAGVTNLRSIRWQQDKFEFAVLGNAPLEELVSFANGVTDSEITIPSLIGNLSSKPQVEVPYNLEIEENDQKSVDAGSSPWKLDPAFVSQVFVSLKISPEGITGEYPLSIDDLNTIENTGKTAIVEVDDNKASIKRVYLKRLIRQDATGIWTVIGYDSVK